jgi:hypothetical protein
VIVTAWEDSNRLNSADYSRMRMAWLVLDGKVYSLSFDSPGGRMPEAIQKRAGLIDSPKYGLTVMEQLFLERYTLERRHFGGNPFPTCPLKPGW